MDKFAFTSNLSAYLLRDGMIDIKDLSQNAVLKQGITFTQFLVENNILSSNKILQYCAKTFGLPICNLQDFDYQSLDHSLIKAELIKRYRVIPLRRDNQNLHLAITDPTDQAAITAIKFHTGLYVQPILVSEDQLNKIITTYDSHHPLDVQVESTLANIPLTDEQSQLYEQLEQNQNDEPVIKFVDQLIHNAVLKHVSDIHIEPYEQYCRIRFRCDGLLYEATILPPYLATRIIARLKVMANLNITEKRLPQDGRIKFCNSPQIENKIEIRINICPTLHGEKIVLRLLNSQKTNLDINNLGLFAEQKQLFLKKLMQPQGLILVTGPTGSGKTMTLYSALHYLNQIEKNISTVEDPVEIELNGINQININPKIGLDFAKILRTLLRQDPDIIMVGEIRDAETAAIAIQAAQTGHLVLSTLHTNNAVETITRLRSLSVNNYNLISSISLIIAQRLIRKLCDCKQPDFLSPERRHQFNLTATLIYQSVGCEHCYQGYINRIGIFEVLPITNEIASLIALEATALELFSEIKKQAWLSLWDAGIKYVANGMTSITELIRVIGERETTC